MKFEHRIISEEAVTMLHLPSSYLLALLILLCILTNATSREFPKGFLFGAATASYQIEGAWNIDGKHATIRNIKFKNVSGKTENIWDRACHKVPSPVADNSTGDIANDSYKLYKRDVEMIRELGVDYYRFSVSWTRILPTSFPDYINEAGVAYYNNLIDELLKYNIEPMLTIYHWDLPQKLQDMGGWTNPYIIDWYADYARVLFQKFGDRVKNWITINEPKEICFQGYAIGTLAPAYTMSGVADYLCGKNVLLAHAKAYHIYDKEFRPTQNGNISITISCQWYEPESDREEDINAANEMILFECGQYGHPIFTDSGDYPEIVKQRVAAKSAEQGFLRSRFPELSPEEVQYIRGTSDFFGLNHYSTFLTYRNESVVGYYEIPSYNDDVGVLFYDKEEWSIGSHNRVKTTPWGFYKLLRQISNFYNNVPIIITENGFATLTGFEDNDRITHLRLYLNALLDAIKDGSDIRLYTPWSLMDNFEWMSGYTQRFGLYEVDYDSPELTRTPRKSAFIFKEIVKSRTLDFDYKPESYVMTIDEGKALINFKTIKVRSTSIPYSDWAENLKCKERWIIFERQTMLRLPFANLLSLLLSFGILTSAIGVCVCHNPRRFPEGFMFSTATASYQIEGAWNVDGKTENIWDHICHKEPSPMADNSTGDIANDSYNLYKRDVEMIRELGIDYYRFSVSWTRILPTSFPDYINEAGVAYYNNLIDELLKHNIKPMLTIYHWDLPQKLQDMGGWTNPYIIDWYADYARVLFQKFGDRVKNWITINEPKEICFQGYGNGTMAPAYTMTGVADYLCGKNVLLAHAKAYHIYDKEFRPTQNGNISITISCQWYEPESDREEDITAANEMILFEWGQYGHPIFTDSGDYPEIVKQRVAAKSAEQGFLRSRFPELSPEEVQYIRGTSDFFGVNHYSTYLAYRNESVVGHYAVPSYFDDAGVIYYAKDEWAIGTHNRIKTTPWGFYKLLRQISNFYNNVPIIITENGFATLPGLEDNDRITHLRLYLNAVLDAIEDGSDIRLYTSWSLMDNFEWMNGYTQRFGFYEVDYDSPERTRTPRKSAFVFKEIVRSRTLDFDYEPESYVMTIDAGK
ncbi:lactase/phlorizin hydrolase [Bombyx mori]|uniref:beta-glucosidase n=1 Tax=Bombyx mori TaxID=7091 RepID=A0A8R2C7J1_BOMMO|nr:lactase-phlorizin hydrolase [Bombyx mori]